MRIHHLVGTGFNALDAIGDDAVHHHAQVVPVPGHIDGPAPAPILHRDVDSPIKRRPGQDTQVGPLVPRVDPGGSDSAVLDG